MRNDVGRAIHLALRLLDDAEAAALTADVAKRSEESYVLRGRSGIGLTARLAEERGVGGAHRIEFYETNRLGKPVALSPLCWEHTEVFEDGKLRPRARPSLMLRRAMGPEDPFIYLEPGERKRTFVWSRGKLPIGRHRFRFVIGHVRDGWTDVTPTYADGPPVYRRVGNAWLGVVVSNELAFTVDEAPAGDDARTAPAGTSRP
jgi:hypothetical protein